MNGKVFRARPWVNRRGSGIESIQTAVFVRLVGENRGARPAKRKPLMVSHVRLESVHLGVFYNFMAFL